MTSSKGNSLRSFESVLDEYSEELLKFCYFRAPQGTAEDCFQETLLAALREYPETKVISVRAWLLTIAARKCIDAYRSQQRQPLLSQEQLESQVTDDTHVERMENAYIWDMVGMLPNRQQQAVTLRYLADLKYDEIGLVMGCSPEAARRSVFEGLKTLREKVS
jgi:RNA polymerase sigma factor (sigma-70 family)